MYIYTTPIDDYPLSISNQQVGYIWSNLIDPIPAIGHPSFFPTVSYYTELENLLSTSYHWTYAQNNDLSEIGDCMK